MLNQVLGVGVLFSLLLSAPVFSQQHFDKTSLIVKLKEGYSLPSTDLIQNSKHLFGSYYSVRTNHLHQLKNLLEEDRSVAKVEYNYKAPKRKLPEPQPIPTWEIDSTFRAGPFNDPNARSLWAFKSANSYGMAVNDYYDALPENSEQAEIIVAVVDTGVDYEHEDLKDRMWVNEGEIPGNGIDDDGNGYVDDVHGINTLFRDSEGNATGNPRDGHSHGTHVAGTIAATQNNYIGIAGVASTAKIMAIRTVPSNGDETDIDVAESYLYAAKMGAKIINCSFGKANNEGGELVKETIEHIGKEYNVLVVAAAGNESSNIDYTLVYPASFEAENLLVVAATTRYGYMAYFSNYGKKNVDFAAPGSGIYSTTPGSNYASYSGTSMASPNTAGVAAEILSHSPDMTAVALKELLMSTVTPVSDFSGTLASEGTVNLLKAFNEL